jgi:muramoyltetrapeptide carboxypeptidase
VTSRGTFLSTLAVGAATVAASSFPESLARPPRLRRGDRVGLIAPASPPQGNDLDLAVSHVEGLGLVPVLGDYVRERDGYLAGTDAQRTADFNRMARDPEIRAIFSIRGGYGTMRILPSLDYAAIARDPKIVMGYSDLTAILNAVAMRSRVVTFHGPVGAHGSSWSGAAREYIERALMRNDAPQTLSLESAETIAPGRARGRLAGGNLSLVSALTGTPFAVPAADALLFFEETEEAPYRVDRMLTQLQLAGDLRAASGLLAGQCTKCTGEAPTPRATEVIAERLRGSERPAVMGAPIGHVETQWVLPIGVLAELDAERKTLTILEPAVT